MSTRLCIGLVLLSSVARLHAVEPGAIAPDFTLPVLKNPTAQAEQLANAADALYPLLQLSDYRGTVVYLDFWQSSCVPCREALPLLDALRDEFSREDVEILGINTDRSPQDALAFIDEHPVKYPVVNDPAAAVASLYGLSGLPTGYLIGRDGTVQDVFEGFRPGEINELRTRLNALSIQADATEK